MMVGAKGRQAPQLVVHLLYSDGAFSIGCNPCNKHNYNHFNQSLALEIDHFHPDLF